MPLCSFSAINCIGVARSSVSDSQSPLWRKASSILGKSQYVYMGSKKLRPSKYHLGHIIKYTEN